MGTRSRWDESRSTEAREAGPRGAGSRDADGVAGDATRPGPADDPGAEWLSRRVRAASQIRLDKVEAICRKMASGEYQVDPEKVAERILERIDDDDP